MARLVVLYGGLSAEERVLGDDFTTGASDDIRKASDLARRMVSQFGMSARLGAIDYGGERQNPFGIGGGVGREVSTSEATAQAIDEETHALLEHAWGRARSILAEHEGLLHRMAEHLLEKEVLDRSELSAFLAEVAPRPWGPAPVT
jgi:cell division protease FtsH